MDSEREKLLFLLYTLKRGSIFFHGHKLPCSCVSLNISFCFRIENLTSIIYLSYSKTFTGILCHFTFSSATTLNEL